RSSWTVATSGHLRWRSCVLAAKSKRCKDAGSARSQRLRARPRTRQRAALQRPSACEIRRRRPRSLGRDQRFGRFDVERVRELVQLGAEPLLGLVADVPGLPDRLVEGPLGPQVLTKLVLVARDLRRGDAVEVALVPGEERDGLLLHRPRR